MPVDGRDGQIVGFVVDDNFTKVEFKETFVFENDTKTVSQYSVYESNRCADPRFKQNDNLYRFNGAELEFMCPISLGARSFVVSNKDKLMFEFFTHTDNKVWAIADYGKFTYTMFCSDLTEQKPVVVMAEHDDASEAKQYVFDKWKQKESRGYVHKSKTLLDLPS